MTPADGAERIDAPYHRGTNQRGMRDYKERLVLSLVRFHGSLSKTEIARMSGLSAQTVSVIMRGLETDGLLALSERFLVGAGPVAKNI